MLDVGSVIGVKVTISTSRRRDHCTHNICIHAYALLSDRWLDGDVIECPLHGGHFEAKTGKGLGAPITLRRENANGAD